MSYVRSEYEFGEQLADEVFAEWLENGMRIGYHSLTGESYRAGFVFRLMELLDVRGIGRGGVVDQAQGDLRGQKRAGLPLAQTVSQVGSENLGVSVRGDS